MNTSQLIRQFKQHSRPEVRTPIATDFYLPNDSRKDGRKTVKTLNVGQGEGTTFSKIRLMTYIYTPPAIPPGFKSDDITLTGVSLSDYIVGWQDPATDDYVIILQMLIGGPDSVRIRWYNFDVVQESITPLARVLKIFVVTPEI